MNAGREIAEAMASIDASESEERMRLQYRAALKVLKLVPSGTPDSELSVEQREAWASYHEALAWFESSR